MESREKRGFEEKHPGRQVAGSRVLRCGQRYSGDVDSK
jgi:hypothetical protein